MQGGNHKAVATTTPQHGQGVVVDGTRCFCNLDHWGNRQSRGVGLADIGVTGASGSVQERVFADEKRPKPFAEKVLLGWICSSESASPEREDDEGTWAARGKLEAKRPIPTKDPTDTKRDASDSGYRVASAYTWRLREKRIL
ncbi:hypothetical protein JTE90_007814 [Oedothorax gibbosus]|uniref:Uncharacterized protein n=1 Tax=Oedothorax gibbosus TaxID=931172 RepID=A0AAV6VJI6_9ARAC|nr:hypothetical protein JTE90_007814 [Oedothorax gibbosus]